MNFLELMKTRYTAKHYDASKVISESDINCILECARLTPSSVNMQPWRLFHARTAEQKAKLMPCILDFNKSRVANASDIIAICGYKKIEESDFKKVLDQEIADGRLTEAKYIEASDHSRHHFANLHAGSEQSMLAWSTAQCYILLGTIMYAAASLNIDSTAIEGFEASIADEILGLKDTNLSCVCLVALGYRSANDSNTTDKRAKSRLKSSDIISLV